MYKWIKLLLLGSFLSVSSLWLKPADANLLLAPVYLELESQKNQSTGILKVSNTSAQKIRVRIFSTPFTYDKNGVFQKIELGEEKDLTPYLRYSPREITIPPKSERSIRLAAILPPTLPDGEYRVAIFAEALVETLQEQKQNESSFNINLKKRIGSAIYVRKGDIHPNLQVEKAEFDLGKKELRLKLQNTGKATAKATINWQLSQNNQEIVSGKGGGSILPEKTVNFLLSIRDKEKLDLKPGVYQLTGEISWQDGTKKKLPFSVNVEVE